MKITRELLDKTAHLARLEIKDEDAKKLMDDMSAIITWVEKLKEVNTDGVEPLTTMSFEVNALRDDTTSPEGHEKHLDVNQALKNAPCNNSNFFSVPKVLE